MSTPYISRRLKVNAGLVFACIPNKGKYAATLPSANVYFPWAFDRKDATSGVPWWMRVKQFEVDFNFSGTYDLAGTPTAFSYSVTGLVLERGNGAPTYSDLRQRQVPGEPGWSGAETTGPDTTNIGLNLFFTNSLITAAAASPFIAYQVDATDIAPAFFFETQSSLSGIGTFNIYSFPVTGAADVGGGTLDGNSFDLYSDAVDGVTILSLSASATITTLTEYTF